MADRRIALLFDGPALVDNRMDVRDLAPALLAFGDVFREANALINPGAPPVSLEIQAVAPGSFDLHLILTAKDHWHGFVEMFSGDTATALANLDAIVVSHLIGLVLILKGRKIRKQERITPGTVRLTLSDGTVFDVPVQALELLAQPTIRDGLHDAMKPLSKPGVDLVRITPEDREPVVVTADQVDAFDFPPGPETPLIDNTATRALSIASVAFTEGNKWRLSDGSHTFYATIADEDFLARVEQGVESFRKGDILRCELQTEQWQTDTGLRTEYTVLDVSEHLPAVRQPSMFDFVEEAEPVAPSEGDGPPAPDGRTPE